MNPHYNYDFADQCEDLFAYNDLYHAIHAGRDLKPLYMWNKWPELVDAANSITEEEFVRALEAHDQELELSLEQDDD